MTTQPTTHPNILQLTNVEQDERYYLRKLGDGTTQYAPSWTYVLSCTWPHSVGLERWRGDVGNERADQIMEQAAAEGTYVHDACQRLLKGEWIAAEDVRRQFPRARALKPLRCIQAFVDWCHQFEPEPLALESVTWLDDPPAAGTVDFVGWIRPPVKKGRRVVAGDGDKVLALLDWKSSRSIHDSHYAQVAGYRLSQPAYTVGILHLGNSTAQRWTLHDITDELDAWEAKALQALLTFHLHHPDAKPSEEQFPAVFTLHPDSPAAEEPASTDPNG